MIKLARQDAHPDGGGSPTQAWLAKQFTPQRTPQQISQFESDNAVPDIPTLVQLYWIVHHNRSNGLALAQGIVPWLIAWMATKSIRHEEAALVFEEALKLFDSTSRERHKDSKPKPLTSLADFPGVDPLTIILGDRREPRVTSAAECLIYSGSATDAMYLPHLGRALEDTIIRSDKLLVRMPFEYLEEETPEIAERNLLVLGSPAVNWGARILNKGAVFPFRIDPDVVKQSEVMLNDDRMQDEAFASEFWDLAQSADEDGVHLNDTELAKLNHDEWQQREGAAQLARRVLGGSTAKAVMNKFRALGVLDPADQENHGTFVHSANDFAVVTLARNPYSKSGRHRAVICAGIHGPGTAASLRELLTNPEIFVARPLGAVLEVKLRTDLAWPDRFERAKVTLQTREYSPRAVMQNIERALREDNPGKKNVYKWWDKAALEDVASFIGTILHEMSYDART
ncbi:MAG: hypothetical protein ACRDTE_22570 [Pseudonocardiaceae bacterium]